MSPSWWLSSTSLPRIALRLLETERDPLALAVDVQDLHVDRLADLEHLGRMVDVAPRKLGDVDETVHPVEIDERAEVDDVRDRPLDLVARVELVEDALPLILALLLEHGAAREDDVVALAVELDDLALELLARELFEILHAADVDERRGQEAADAEVEDEAALDDLDHAAGDRIAVLVGGLDRLPRDLEAGALLRKDEPAFGVLLREHERRDVVADRDLVGRVDRAPDRQLRDRDDALRLVADVDEHLVLVHADDRAVDDLPFLDRREGRLVVGDELAALRIGRPDAFGEPRVVDGLIGHKRGAQCSGARPSAGITLRRMDERYPIGVTSSCAVTVLRQDGAESGYGGWSAAVGLLSGEATFACPGTTRGFSPTCCAAPTSGSRQARASRATSTST